MSDKAILVMNTPDNCDKCVLKSLGLFNNSFCKVSKEFVCNSNNRPKSCPLKELPEFHSTEHVDYAHEASEINGWNKCLEKLLSDEK
jgi:hypothetical protein